MTLLQEILTKCTAEEVQEGNFHLIAAKVNLNRKVLQQKMISERGIRSALGPVAGSKFMVILKELSVAETCPAWLTGVLTAIGIPQSDHVYYLDTFSCGLEWVKSDSGLDIGDATVRSLLNTIAAGNLDLQSSIGSLKQLAEVREDVSWMQCQDAIEKGV